MSESPEVGREGKSAPPPSPAAPPASPARPAQISLEDFQKIALRTGRVVAAADHPNADRLLVLTVDLGEGSFRQLVAGIKGSYQASQLVGKQVVVVANLKPAVLRGVESQGMALAVSDGSSTILIAPEQPVQAGSSVR